MRCEWIPFVDWVLRFEKQAKLCEFGEEQRKEEFIQALIRRSVPVIAEKLYEMSHIWDNDMEKIVNYGKHLDYMRAEIKEASDKAKTSSNANEAMDTDSESPYKAVNVLHNRGHKAFSNRFEPYRRREVNRSSILQRRTNLHTGRRSDSSRTSRCNKCGTSYRPRDCKAFRAKCFNCDMVGHFAEFCREPSRSGDRSRSLKPSYRTDYIKEQASSINQVSFENTNDSIHMYNYTFLFYSNCNDLSEIVYNMLSINRTINITHPFSLKGYLLVFVFHYYFS